VGDAVGLGVGLGVGGQAWFRTQAPPMQLQRNPVACSWQSTALPPQPANAVPAPAPYMCFSQGLHVRAVTFSSDGRVMRRLKGPMAVALLFAVHEQLYDSP
jgi:hypothetical protein